VRLFRCSLPAFFEREKNCELEHQIGSCLEAADFCVETRMLLGNNYGGARPEIARGPGSRKGCVAVCAFDKLVGRTAWNACEIPHRLQASHVTLAAARCRIGWMPKSISQDYCNSILLIYSRIHRGAPIFFVKISLAAIARPRGPRALQRSDISGLAFPEPGK